MKKIIAFSGSHSQPSKTIALVETIAHITEKQHDVHLTHYNMSHLGSSLGLAQTMNDLSLEAQKIITDIASADALIIGTPVYKGSYPGLFKHFIDLLPPELLYGKPILLAATGGGHRHALMVEHQLRPLFGFFMAHGLPTAIYASSDDFSDDNKVITPALLARIHQAVKEFSPFIQRQSNHSTQEYVTHITPPRTSVTQEVN